MITELSVVIPAYNEEQGIIKVLEDLTLLFEKLTLEYELIVVDDGSIDHTRRLVSEFKGENVVLIHHEQNRGYGAALKSGIKRARYETIVVIDADCTYPVKKIPDLLEKLESSDMVVGARVGETVKIESIRKPAKWLLTKLASFLSEKEILDLNSGLRTFKKKLALKYFHILPNKFSFTTTITLAMLADGYDVSYVQIDYYPRKGRSKIKPGDAFSFFLLIFRTILYFNPLKIIIPVTFTLGSLGVGKLVFDLLMMQDVGDSTIFLILFSFQLLILGLLADLIVRRT